MRYQAILFDLDGTLLPMEEPVFIKCFYGALIKFLGCDCMPVEQVKNLLMGSLSHVISNDGSCTNRQAFADYYAEYEEKMGMRISVEAIEEFYRTMFDTQVRSSCGFDPWAPEVVTYIKATNTPMIVATNPFFPRIATNIRLCWAGLDPADFADITVYENSHYCKPNLLYYQELFDRTGYDPTQCLMVGNNVDEDMIAEQLGCDVFLITRNLINAREKDILHYKHGSLEALLNYLKKQ